MPPPSFRCGLVSADNIDSVAAAIRDVLTGHLYASASLSLGLDRIRVEPDQRLDSVDVRGPSIYIRDTYGLHPIGIGAYVAIDGCSVHVRQSAPAGNPLVWVFTAQQEAS